MGYWAYIWGTYIRGGGYILNEVSVSTCCGLIHEGGGLIFGEAYSWRFTVFNVHRWSSSEFIQTRRAKNRHSEVGSQHRYLIIIQYTR